MEDLGILGVMGVIVTGVVIVVILYGCLYLIKDAHNKDFIKDYQSKPYCIQDQVTVIDKTIKLKRCFKVVEVKWIWYTGRRIMIDNKHIASEIVRSMSNFQLTPDQKDALLYRTEIILESISEKRGGP